MPSALPKCCSSLWGWGKGPFLPSFLRSPVLPTLLTIVRATLLSQSKDQNSSHVSREQMSYHLGWCEHRYNADRKLEQSLGEPIMGWAVGAGLQTVFFFFFVSLLWGVWLTSSPTVPRQPGVYSLCRWQSGWVVSWSWTNDQNKSCLKPRELI